MDMVNIPLPESLKDFVQTRIAEGGYSSVGEYVCALIQADQNQQALAVLEAEVLKGVHSGPAEPMTAHEWESIRDEVRRRFEARKTG